MMKINKSVIINSIQKGIRLDGRKLEEFRDIEIIPNYINKNPEGCALVKIGKTKVLVGVKMGVGKPYQDSPDEGVLMTGAELSPIAAPEFESGPPREAAIELARVVDRGIRESKMINTKALCIKEREAVWLVFLDIQILDYDGNLFDAAALGAVVALMNTKIPTYDLKTEKIDFEKYSGKLELNEVPISITARKISGKIVFDPNAEEEELVDSRLTFAFKENGNICAMQKGGSEPITKDEILDLMKKSSDQSKIIRKKLKNIKIDK